MEVHLYVREKELMDGVDIAKKGYINVLRTLASAIGLAIENIRLYETVKAQSTTDGLTQVRNRRYLSMRLADEITRARRYSRDMSLLIVDLDNLKPINDKLGHRQGDLVLQELATIFVRSTRATDIVCRYGGDEFVIILPETSLMNAFHTAELLLKKVIARRVRNVTNPRKPLKISVSIGVGSISSEIATEDALLRVADQSLYEAKNSGKSRVHALQLPGAGRPRSKR
jgi:diguanylate cyclase (GGDEF)-like protein